MPVETGTTSNGKTELITKDNSILGKIIVTKNAYAVLSKLKNTQADDHH